MLVTTSEVSLFIINCIGERGSEKKTSDASKPHRRNVSLRHYKLSGFVTTLTFDL